MGADAAYLMLAGGFTVSAGNAMGRKDVLHTLLFAFLGLASAQLAGVPVAILGAAWTVYVIALLLFSVRALVRLCTGADGFNRTVAATIALSLAALLVDTSTGFSSNRTARLTLIGKSLHRSFAGAIARFDGTARLR